MHEIVETFLWGLLVVSLGGLAHSLGPGVWRPCATIGLLLLLIYAFGLLVRSSLALGETLAAKTAGWIVDRIYGPKPNLQDAPKPDAVPPVPTPSASTPPDRGGSGSPGWEPGSDDPDTGCSYRMVP